MAHELYIANGKASMAYSSSGGVPWHSLGQAMPETADLETWREACGFDFEIIKVPVDYKIDGLSYRFHKRYVMARSDNHEPISIMSEIYKTVQPKDILNFFKGVCEFQGWKMETAGVLRGGAQYWAMARTGDDFVIGKNDKHVLFVLLVTSVDGSLPTTGFGTDVRGVCANTIRLAMLNAEGKIICKHNKEFDAEQMQKELGMIDYAKSWDTFHEKLRLLSDVPISSSDATKFFGNLLRPVKDRKPVVEQEQLAAQDFSGLLTGRVKAGAVSAQVVEQENNRAIRGLQELETSYYQAPGACPGTLYGVLQGVTHFLDHSRGSDANRLSSAWFGQGAQMKEAAFQQLIERAATA